MSAIGRFWIGPKTTYAYIFPHDVGRHATKCSKVEIKDPAVCARLRPAQVGLSKIYTLCSILVFCKPEEARVCHRITCIGGVGCRLAAT